MDSHFLAMGCLIANGVSKASKSTIWIVSPAGGSTQIRPGVGPVHWLIGNRSSPSRQGMALILCCTACVLLHHQSGAVMC